MTMIEPEQAAIAQNGENGSRKGILHWLIRPLEKLVSQSQPNYGYTVRLDDFPARMLPTDATVERVAAALDDFERFFPGAVESLKHAHGPDGNGAAAADGHPQNP